MCQFIVEQKDMLYSSVGVKNVAIYLKPDLEREAAEELRVGLGLWLAAG
jgi:hypothetical protein